MAELDLQAEPERTIEKPLVPLGQPLRVDPEHHPLGPIVQTALGQPAKVLKGVQVAAQKDAGVRPRDELQVEHPGPTQHHREGPHAPEAAGRRPIGAAPEVDLRLLPGGHLEAAGPLTGGRWRRGWTNALRIVYPPV